MKLKLGWIALGLVAFIFFLLAYLPANQVLGRMALPQNVSVSGVSGTIWNGSAKEVIVSGLPIKRLEWSLNPVALILGSASADVKAGNVRNKNDIAFSGPISINLFDQQQIKAEDFTLYVPASYAVANVALPFPVEVGGRFKVQLSELALTPICDALEGNGDWLNAQVSGTQGMIDLGNYEATLSCVGEQIGITVKEPNLLGLSMTATINPQSNNVGVNGQFKVAPSLPEEVQIASQIFGQPNSQGYTEFAL